jgi:sulfoxide reductase heme-binding subunit YedZ
MGHRVLQRRGLADRPWALPALALGTALLTAALEAGWYAVGTGVPGLLVLEANLDPSDIRPAWWVFGVGLALAVLGFAREGARRDSGRGRRPGATVAA